MIIIQCDVDTFNKICDLMAPAEPIIIETSGRGYIDCFDKDWVFISTEVDLTKQLSKLKEAKYLIGVDKTLIQHNINEIEKYIFLRKGEILWGASSYIIFGGNKK